MAPVPEWTPLIGSTLDMPDLSDVMNSSMNVGIFSARALIGEERPRPENVDERHFIRLVDKAIVSYESCRLRLMAVVNRKSDEFPIFKELVRGQSDCETCLGALRRALEYADVISRTIEPPFTAEEIPVDSDGFRVVRELRNAMEHTESYVRPWKRQGIRLGEDEHVLPRLWAQGVEFAGETLSFQELAGWLRELDRLAFRVADQNPPLISGVETGPCG